VAAGFEPLTRHWRTRRDEARDQLVELLDSKSYATFIDDAIGFVERPGLGVARSGPLAGARVRDVAAGRIWQAYERVRVHDAGLPWADVPALHALRIDGKRLRYTLESFREVLDEPVGELIEAVTAMQDQLGELNDAQVAADLVRGWLLRSAADLPGPVQRAAGGYLLARERAVPRLRRSFPPVWRRVAGPPFRRRLALVVSRL
jgi:CHAD domain-containing protein